jgi:PilZ domain
VWLGRLRQPTDASLDRRSLCLVHFYRVASLRLGDFEAAIEKDNMPAAEKGGMLGFLSEIVNESTRVMASAKSLTESQRKQFLDLSRSASEFYKRAQRSPRRKRELPVVLRRDSGAGAATEAAKTVNVSKRGACIETSASLTVGETVWIRRTDIFRQARALVVWLKVLSPSKNLTGLRIVDPEDFWGLEH